MTDLNKRKEGSISTRRNKKRKDGRKEGGEEERGNQMSTSDTESENPIFN